MPSGSAEWFAADVVRQEPPQLSFPDVDSIDSGGTPGGDPLDPAVVAALYVEHGEELRRFLIGVLRDPQLASDVLQTTFVKLVERGGRSAEESRKAWLFRVAYHEALAQRRRQSVGSEVLRRVAWITGDSSGHTPADDSLVRFEAVHAVHEALQTLPREQQQIVRMRIFEEKTFATIAAELGIPLGTALARMRAALAKLRSRLTMDDQPQ
jgi:RNA polymerase sigma factor (sigma-70 family)